MGEPLIENPVAVFLVIMAVILLAPLIIERFRMPGIVGIIIGGIIIGPHALNLLSTEYTIETLAVIGLVYLMFSVGLEIDLRQFRKVRNRSVVFGMLTFAVPALVGMLVGRWLGFEWNSSVLLGAVIASHALINYPLLRRLGILRNEAVATTLGATIFTDVSALLVLAFVVRTKGGGISVLSYLFQVVVFIAYTLLILIAVPRLGKFFFRRFTGRAVEFQFIILVLLVASLLAELIEMHVIIGAFLAGLAINSSLPSGSSVVNRVLFLGEAFFIPIFLIYIGMIIDPATMFTEPNTLLPAGIMIMTVYLTKLIPSWVASGIYKYSRDELMTVWGISQAQATTTLAILLVGVDMGLLTTAVFNGGVLMVMVTCISSSIIVQRFGSRLISSKVPEEEESHYRRILVSLANPKTHENLIELAAILARTVSGKLLPLHITLRGQNERFSGSRELGLLAEAEDLNDPDTDVQLLHRVDTDIVNGILHTAIENDATMIVMGWHGEKTYRESAFGSIVDQVLWNTEVPVMVGRINQPIKAVKRLVLVVPQNSCVAGSTEDVLETVTTLSVALNIPMIVLSEESYLGELRSYLDGMDTGPSYKVFKLGRSVVRDVVSRTNPMDLIVVTTLVSRMRFGSCLGRIPEQLADASEASLTVIVYPY